MRRAFTVAPLVALLTFLPSTSHAPAHRVHALAPVELVADGFRQPAGVLVDEPGAIFVSDRKAGTITRIAPDGSRALIVTGLKRPVGLALDQGRLLIAEAGRGRVLRLEPSGALTVLASGIKHPRWLAADEGTVYVSADGLHRHSDEDDEEDDAWHRQGEVILRLSPDGALTRFAQGFKGLEGLALQSGALYAVTERLRGERERHGTTLVRIPIQPDGSTGPLEVLLRGDIRDPVGLALDRLGAAFFTAERRREEHHHRGERGVIVKWRPDGRLVTFALGLKDPRGVAFEAEGHLLVAEGEHHHGRLLRFRAPALTLNPLPAFTNQSPFPLGGTTAPGARVDVFVNDAPTAVTGLADAAGAFSLPVPLTRPNALNEILALAIAQGGDGLASAGAEATLTHDGIAPGLQFLQPPANAFVRQSVTVRADATDSGTGVQNITLSADTQSLTTTLSPTSPASPVTATSSWNTTTFLDGTHTLTATATDVAGNPTSATRTVIVDNTPPDTQITGGPAGGITTTEATFTFTGTDNLTAPQNLLFAWSLDGAPFGAFSSATSASFMNLPEGLHTFQAKARDQAGNEDPTPASQSFTVTFGPLISTVDPPSGSVGAYLTLTGARFEPGATQVAVNGVAAVIRTITATTITTTVPIGATTGNLTVTTTRGTARRAFTVTTSGDFTVTVSPATVPAVQGTSVEVRVDAPASGSYTGLIALGTGALPSGVAAAFSAPTLTPNGTAILTLTTTGTAPLGPSTMSITGTATIDGRPVTRSASITLDVQPPGQTVLAGQVRDENDLPLAGVRISLGGASITPLGTTDAGGNFLIPLSVTRTQIFLIDGSALNTGTTFYPAVPVTVTIQPSVVNSLGFIARLRAIPAAKLTPITPGQPAVVTDPELPGFSVTIPSGVSIIGWDGQPNTQIGVTQIPLDRSPLPPTPVGLSGGPIYLFSFGKVGGGLPMGNVVIDTPNDLGALPGEPVDLYFFNEAPDGTAPNQWEQYGTGTVSEDGTRIVTDINPATSQPYGIPRFCCGARWNVRSVSDRLRGPYGGEPVDLSSGRFIVQKTDLVLPGRLPITIQRFYRSAPLQSGAFGLNWSLAPYDQRLILEGFRITLETADRSPYAFVQVAPGRCESQTEPAYRGAVLTQLASLTFDLRLKDGTVQRFEPGDFPNVAVLASITDRTGNRLTITRELFGTEGFHRISRITESAGRAVTFSYDAPGGRLSALTDPLFRQVRYTYDAQGRLETVTDPAGGVTRYTYDATHRVLTITDPRGITFIQNEYDASDRVVRQTQADGGVWTFSYQAAGSRILATTVTDPRGNPTTYRFNGQGFTLTQTDALGQPTTFDYEPGTNLLRSTTDPLGRVSRFTYDTQGNVTTITDPAGNTRTLTYEPTFNRVTSIRDPLGNLTQFGYDASGNLTSITDPLGARTTIAYNSFGQPVSTTDPPGNTATFAYDGAGNLTTITDPLNNATTRAYDLVSRLITQADPRGQRTAFAYDSLNRLTQIADALNGMTGFAYDPNGNLLTVTDARGNSIAHTYDSMDRLATRTDPVGAAESFTYDGAGNLLQHTDRKGQVATFGYDALNRRTGAAYADGSSTSFAYDAGGRLLQASDSGGGSIINAYDVLDRLTAQATGLGTITYQYDALNRRTRMDAPGQASVFYGYDAASRLRTITQSPLNPVRIDHDTLGRRTLLTLPNGVSTEYQYDNASRLTALIYRNALGLLGDLTYQYDAAGNRIRVGGSFARTLLPDAVPSATYDAANRQLTFGGQTLTYDLNGNLTSDGTSTYTWDARRRLIALSGPGTSASFQYDALGRRTRKIVNGTTTDSLYDRANPVQELSGASLVANVLTGLKIDEYLARTDSAGTRALLTDALGSTVALTGPAGAVQTRYTYEPFGGTTASGSTSGNSLQYTGREADGTGLYYYRARYYHPALHRFISEDPLGGAGGDANLYAYVENNPLNFTDPLGLLSFSTFGSFQLKAVATPFFPFPCCGVQGSLGYRLGTMSSSPSAVAAQVQANVQGLLGYGLSAGRGAQVGFAFANVEDLPKLREVGLDTPLFGASVFFREGQFPIPIGVVIAGPSAGASLTVSHPDLPGKEWSLFDFKFDWKDALDWILGAPGVGNPALSGRKK